MVGLHDGAFTGVLLSLTDGILHDREKGREGGRQIVAVGGESDVILSDKQDTLHRIDFTGGLRTLSSLLAWIGPLASCLDSKAEITAWQLIHRVAENQ